MEDRVDLVLAQRARDEPGLVEVPVHDVDRVLDAVEQQRRARRAVALQHDDALAALHERARRASEPSSP